MEYVLIALSLVAVRLKCCRGVIDPPLSVGLTTPFCVLSGVSPPILVFFAGYDPLFFAKFADIFYLNKRSNPLWL